MIPFGHHAHMHDRPGRCVGPPTRQCQTVQRNSVARSAEPASAVRRMCIDGPRKSGGGPTEVCDQVMRQRPIALARAHDRAGGFPRPTKGIRR